MTRYIVTLLLLFFCRAGFAQNAYIHQDSILKSIPTFTEKLQRITALQQKYSTEISANRENLQKQLNHLIGPYNPRENESFNKLKLRMKPVDTLKLNLLLEDDTGVSKKERAYNNIVKLEYKKNIEPLRQLMQNAVTEYAKQNKLEAVYIIENLNQALAYLDPKKIITKLIIKMVQEQYDNTGKGN